jgi:hypothetical protein
MIRRRRPVREIPFSFDSFLDVVANVVGIIIRLILVVWVGARSYSSLTAVPPSARPAREKARGAGEPQDPLKDELARHRQDLAEAQARLLEQLRQLGQVRARQQETRGELAQTAAQSQKQQQEQAGLERATADRKTAARTVALSLEEIRQKSKQLAEQIKALEKLPPLRKTLHYHTPVSVPVDSEEVMFECHNGRVAFVDIAALLEEVKRGLDDKSKMLQTQWQVDDVAGPVGAFKLHYRVERQRSLFDSVGGDPGPSGATGFRYGLSEWQLEPVDSGRGETEAAALADGSDFRQVVDALDPRQSVVTLWVYPDSFALYRRLRDYLYEHDVVVAGRVLLEGMPISCSRRGTRSRGQ